MSIGAIEHFDLKANTDFSRGAINCVHIENQNIAFICNDYSIEQLSQISSPTIIWLSEGVTQLEPIKTLFPNVDLLISSGVNWKKRQRWLEQNDVNRIHDLRWEGYFARKL
ncbi:hypothetical protein N8482_01645 [Chitinophagales bacterium]|nr:hypothetical protein [Chitinophagales bacterium]